MPTHMTKHPKHPEPADRRPSRPCPRCRFGHEGAGVVCDVCAGILSPEEQQTYLEKAILASHDASIAAAKTLINEASLPSTTPTQEQTGATAPEDAVLHRATTDTLALPVPENIHETLSPQHKRRCIVCRHPDRAAIDAALIEDVSCTTLEHRYIDTDHPFSENSALLHKNRCMRRASQSHNNERVQKSYTLPRAPCTVCAHPAAEAINAGLRADTLTLTEAHTTYRLHRAMLSHHRIECLGLPRMTKAQAAFKGSQSRKRTGRRCIVCRHPDIVAINIALESGATCLAMQQRYADTEHPFSDHSVSQHRRVCLGMAALHARQARMHQQQDEAPLPAEPVAASNDFATRAEAEIQRLDADIAKLTNQHEEMLALVARLKREYAALRTWQDIQSEHA